MQYIIAFLIFVLIISIIGFIFSFLWPFIVALLLIVAVMNLLGYRRRKKHMDEFYRQTDDLFHNRGGSNGYDRGNQSTSTNDEIIDVEFTETDADE